MMRLAIAVLISVTLAALAATLYAAHLHEQATAQLHTLEKRRAARIKAEAEAARLASEAQAIQTRLASAAPLLQPANRLDWLEALRATRTRLRIPRLDYEFAPSRPTAAARISTPHPKLSWVSHPLQLQLALTQEQQLLDLLASLRERTQPFLHINSCEVRRATAAPGAQLDARCSLEWISVKITP